MPSESWQSGIPEWLEDAVFYQIFPDRFERGNRGPTPPNEARWGSAPTCHSVMGGDLSGIVKRIDYLRELGVNALYLNPIFLASSNHKYNTYDYYQVDYNFGSIED